MTKERRENIFWSVGLEPIPKGGDSRMDAQKILGALSTRGGARKSLPADPEERKVEILTLLEELGTIEDRSGKAGRSIRKRLRDMGFHLSNPEHVSQVKEWTEALA